MAGKYSRFLHVRHLSRQEEVVALIEALTGRKWNPADVFYGAMRSPEEAEYLRRDALRLDQRLGREWGARVEDDAAKQEIVRP